MKVSENYFLRYFLFWGSSVTLNVYGFQNVLTPKYESFFDGAKYTTNTVNARQR